MQQLQSWLLHIPNTDEDNQRRGRVIIVLALLMSGLALSSIPLVFALTPQSALTVLLINATGVIIYTLVIALCRIGWVQRGGLLFIITITSLTLTILFLDDNLNCYSVPFFLIFTILITGMILPPAWIWFALILNMTGLLAGWWTTGQLLFFKQPEGTFRCPVSASWVSLVHVRWGKRHQRRLARGASASGRGAPERQPTGCA